MSRLFAFCASLVFLALAVSSATAQDLTLFDAAKEPVDKLVAQSAKLTLKDGTLSVETEKGGQWPGFNMGRRDWNLVACDHLLFDMTNHDDKPLSLNCRVDSPDIDWGTMRGTYTQSFTLAPGETTQARINLPPLVPPQLQGKFFGMRGAPGGGPVSGKDAKPGFHKDKVVGLTLFLNQPGRETRWSVRKIVAVPSKNAGQAQWYGMSPEEFFPMIDRFGQFKHDDWPGKIHSDDELKASVRREEADMKKYPGPKNRGRYGGDTASPRREATGHFRVEKLDGRWWFVDPEGYLFWSHGSDCVRFGNASTPILDREFYFEDLPPRDDAAFKGCYHQGWWAPHNYYEDKIPFDMFNFSQANLIRKYGDDWRKISAELAHRRLKSWGMNTIANWSDPGVYELRQTPYTAVFGSGGRVIEGSGGYWGKFPDPFSKEFEDNLRRNAEREKQRSGSDPWCIGYFVDNEISWGGERSLAIGAITSPPDQPAKLAFIEDLKAKYGEIARLNAAWGSTHADWNALTASKEKPDESRAGADLDAFHRRICEQYFKTIRDAVKAACPDKLYLGCRFAWSNDTAIRVSADYCDVVSFNKYQRSLADFRLPEGMDMPVVIGEFHFGALDRGMFHTGLVPTESQEKRAEAYETYVRSALEHPQVVGTHWFQYGDQATTGREDGENYQIGLVDIVDVPYPETIDAVRRVGYDMYEIRKKSEKR